MALDDDIRAYVQRSADRFIDSLKEACSLPSISTEGQGLDEMAGWLQAQLEGLGAAVTRLEVPGSPAALVGDIPGDGRNLMIYDHYDVQPVDPLDLWESPPFEPEIRGDRLYARGAADNKGDLVARLCAIEVYREVIGDIPFGLKFFVEGEEETGSPHFEDICKKFSDQLQADDCVWEGGGFDHRDRPTIYFGCKGLLYVELWCKKLSGDQHSSIAGYAPSAAWRLVQALSSIRDDSGRILVDGFYDDVEPLGPKELAIFDESVFEEEAERTRLGCDEFDRGLTGTELKRELFLQPTANIAGLNTGYTVPGASKTVLPAEAMAKMDFRLVPNQDPEDLSEKLRSHLASAGFDDIEVRVLGAEHPSASPLETPLGTSVRSTTESWFKRPPKVWPFMYATGPMYPIAQGLGIPICSPAGVGRPDSQVHAPNENARLNDYLDVIGYTVYYLHAYSNS